MRDPAADLLPEGLEDRLPQSAAAATRIERAVLSILDTQGQNLSFAATAGMAVVWIAVASALAVIRTSRRDIT